MWHPNQDPQALAVAVFHRAEVGTITEVGRDYSAFQILASQIF